MDLKKSMLQIAVCVGENENAARICNCLEKLPALEGSHITIYTDFDALFAAAKETRQNLVIMATSMNGRSGIAAAAHLCHCSRETALIYVSDNYDRIQEAIPTVMFGYVLYDQLEKDLPPAVDFGLNGPNHLRVAIHSSGRNDLIFQYWIIYMERKLRTTYIYTFQGVYATSEKLDDLVARINPSIFCQCHKSFALNWFYVKNFTKNSVELLDGTVLHVSRSHVDKMRESFKLFEEKFC